MSVLIVKNISNEGPGTIEKYLIDNSIDYRIIDLSIGEREPNDFQYNCLIILGGPMSVNDTSDYPYIEYEIDLVDKAIYLDKKVFGICLGAQIIAKTLGANVFQGVKKEIGWYDIEFSYSGMLDAKIRKLSRHPNVGDIWRKIKVFQWHGETFDLPRGATHLASSALYPNQAFKFGNNVYAFQFHIEVTPEIISEWIVNEPIDIDAINADSNRFFDIYYKRAINFYDAFFKDDYSY
ncbi:MAG: type 1 glutamine amidotransferase [Thermodesulfovibrionales bacterium]|nr:type 1 glutamine amidotransferase [Thermodesulfovibrionales bacterium]